MYCIINYAIILYLIAYQSLTGSNSIIHFLFLRIFTTCIYWYIKLSKFDNIKLNMKIKKRTKNR